MSPPSPFWNISMKFTFLKANVPLTKSFQKKPDGTIVKSSYPNVYEVTTIREECDTLDKFAALLKKHAALGHCLLKGNPTRDLAFESRAGTTDTNAATEWIVLDVDGLDCKDVSDFMRLLKLDQMAYVVQYSASYKITGDDLRCHIYVWLDQPLAAPLIKQWLIQMNHTIAQLSNAMTLTKTGNSVSWALDITACQNDKLLYIAPPLLKGMKDPLKGERIISVPGANKTLIIPGTINTTAQNKVLTNKRINELRDAAGYEARKVTYKVHGAMEVMVKPDSCTINDIKTERGYVYFNLNGGDSWGYYHAEDNPDYIHNFKGEPVYLTKELLPDYWQQLTQNATAERSDGTIYLAFCDKKTGVYWRGTYEGATDKLDIYAAKNETQVRHFAKQHGMPLGDFIPEWDLVFDPQDNVRVDIENRTVNTFQPTIYMQQVARKVSACPKTILRVIHHALGEDADMTEHFMNWLAYIVQNRTRACTSWVLHGRTGTGKGVLFHKILRPLFGTTQTVFRNMEALDEKYNEFIERALIIFVDEVESKSMLNENGVLAKLRTFVTEESVSIRAMHQGSREINNYSNWIFSSNKPDPVKITQDDRRTNVAKYQPNQLELDSKGLEAIKNELQTFHDYLLSYAVDLHAVKTPIESSDRDTMISLSESSIDTVGSALLGGDMEFFIDQMPTNEAYLRNALESNKVGDYKDVLKALLLRTDRATGACNISREELRTLFDYTVGNMPGTPNKFTSLLKHHRIHIKKVWINTAVAGLAVVFKDVTQFDAFDLVLNPRPTAPAKLKGVK